MAMKKQAIESDKSEGCKCREGYKSQTKQHH